MTWGEPSLRKPRREEERGRGAAFPAAATCSESKLLKKEIPRTASGISFPRRRRGNAAQALDQSRLCRGWGGDRWPPHLRRVPKEGGGGAPLNPNASRGIRFPPPGKPWEYRGRVGLASPRPTPNPGWGEEGLTRAKHGFEKRRRRRGGGCWPEMAAVGGGGVIPLPCAPPGRPRLSREGSRWIFAAF